MLRRSVFIMITFLSATTGCATAAPKINEIASAGSTDRQTPVSAQAVTSRPDFSGIWDRYPDPYEGGVDYPPPPGGPPPLREPYLTQYNQGIAKRDAILKSGGLVDEPSTRCLPEGMPTIMAGTYPIEIMQSGKQLVVLAEFLSQTRRIYIGEEMPPAEDIFPSYNGYSVAHWEGDVLVVETRGIKESVPFMTMPHSPELQITERFALVAPDLLEDRITMTDPKIFEKPYSFTFGYKRLSDYKIQENICDNNRYSVDEAGQPDLNTDAPFVQGGK